MTLRMPPVWMLQARQGVPVLSIVLHTIAKRHEEEFYRAEIFTLSFSRDRLTLASYEDDAIRTAVETWADAVPALA